MEIYGLTCQSNSQWAMGGKVNLTIFEKFLFWISVVDRKLLLQFSRCNNRNNTVSI